MNLHVYFVLRHDQVSRFLDEMGAQQNRFKVADPLVIQVEDKWNNECSIYSLFGLAIPVMEVIAAMKAVTEVTLTEVSARDW